MQIMMMYAVLALWAGVILWLSFKGSKKTTNLSDYALGSFQFSPAAVALSLAASMTSAATFIINPGLIGMYGISGVLSYAIVLPAGALLSLVILTKSFRKHGSTSKALTLAQWMQTRFQSKSLGLLFGFLSLLLITFLVLIMVGLTQVISKAIQADAVIVLVVLVIFTFGYMMFGGANTMVYTNTLQALLMLVVALILLGSGYEHFSEGVHGFMQKLKAIDPDLVTFTNKNSPLFRDYFEIIFAQFIVGVAVVCQPHIITKSLLLKDEKQVNTFLWIAILVEILFFSVVFTGLYARIEFPDMMLQGVAIKPDGLISTYVMQEFPVFVGVIVVLGLLSAGISTLEGLIQSLSTTLSIDIIKPLVFKGEEKPILMKINKLVIIFLALVTFIISYKQITSPNLSVAILAQNGVYAYFAAAFVPVLMGLFWPKTPSQVVITAALAAIAIHFGIYYLELGSYMQAPVKNPAIPASIAISSSLLLAFLLNIIFRKTTI